jgi:hypothetical protein
MYILLTRLIVKLCIHEMQWINNTYFSKYPKYSYFKFTILYWASGMFNDVVWQFGSTLLSTQWKSYCGCMSQIISEWVMKNLLSSLLLSRNTKIIIYKIIVLPVVLYGCETWSRTLREEHKLRVFEKGVLRRIFGSKRWSDKRLRKLHNEEIHSLYSSPSIIRMM